MRKRKFWSVALATAVATMLPVSALAKTWDNVDSWDKLAEAFGDTDADVTIILTGDIQFAGSLEAKEGQTYTSSTGIRTPCPMSRSMAKAPQR